MLIPLTLFLVSNKGKISLKYWSGYGPRVRMKTSVLPGYKGCEITYRHVSRFTNIVVQLNRQNPSKKMYFCFTLEHVSKYLFSLPEMETNFGRT